MLPIDQDPTVEDLVYVLIEQGTNGIVGFTRCEASAKAVLLSSRRLKMNALDFSKDWLDTVIKEADLTGHYKLEIRQGQKKFETLSGPEIEDSFYSILKKSVPVRLFFQNALFALSKNIMLSVPESPVHQSYMDTLIHELNQCQPNEGIFTDAVKSYAVASDTSDWGAYQELMLAVNNISHARMRNLGLYVKYRNALNRARATRDEQGQVLAQARNAFLNNSYV